MVWYCCSKDKIPEESADDVLELQETAGVHDSADVRDSADLENNNNKNKKH